MEYYNTCIKKATCLRVNLYNINNYTSTIIKNFIKTRNFVILFLFETKTSP